MKYERAYRADWFVHRMVLVVRWITAKEYRWFEVHGRQV